MNEYWFVFAANTLVKDEGERDSHTDRTDDVPSLPLPVPIVYFVDSNPNQRRGETVSNLDNGYLDKSEVNQELFKEYKNPIYGYWLWNFENHFSVIKASTIDYK